MSNTGIYYIDGKIVAESGKVKIYNMDGQFFLEIGPGHNLWTLDSELEDYTEQLRNAPKGNVLEIGLGLGVASRYLLSCPNVKSLTTIEINKDVINVYNEVKTTLDKKLNLQTNKQHTIVNSDGLSYVTTTRDRYNFIFMDHYSLLDEETLPEIEKLVKACESLLLPAAKIFGWWDKFTPEEFVLWFNRIFNCNFVAKE